MGSKNTYVVRLVILDQKGCNGNKVHLYFMLIINFIRLNDQKIVQRKMEALDIFKQIRRQFFRHNEVIAFVASRSILYFYHVDIGHSSFFSTTKPFNLYLY